MAAEARQPTDERTRDWAARVAMIDRGILALLLIGLLIGVIAVVKPFTTAILFGAALATAAWPMRQALVRRGLGRGAAGATLLLFRSCSSFCRCSPLHLIWPSNWSAERNVCNRISRRPRISRPGSEACRCS